MTDQATRVVFDDPHQTGPAEAETMRVRPLTGIWRWSLVALTAVTIFLCINQQFALRFFVGFTPLNTEYFYLLILCMLPFTFVIFPGSSKASVNRVAWYDIVLFLGTAVASIYLMLNIRKAAELGWEFGDPPKPIIWAGLFMWFVLMEALRRTGGWSSCSASFPSLSIRCSRAQTGWGRSRATSRPSIRRSPIMCSRPRAFSASPSRLSPMW